MPTRWTNSQGEISPTRPQRVRLPSGLTATNETITDQLLEELGWYEETYEIYVPPMPQNTSTVQIS